jgi:hypothetical protein
MWDVLYNYIRYYGKDRYLRLMERAVRIAVGRVRAVVVVRPKPMNAEICFGFSSCWIATTLFCVAV